MKEKTQEFVELVNENMATKTISKRNMVIFNKTVLGDSLDLPQHRTSESGNAIPMTRILIVFQLFSKQLLTD